MKTASDSTDKVGKMIRLAGFETPAPGMPERIMNRIEVASLKKSWIYKPVIGFKGWILIGLLGIIVIILFYFLISNDGSNAGNRFFDTELIHRKIADLDKSIRFNLQVPKVMLFGLTGLLIWIGLDFLMDTLKWKRHTARGMKQ